MAKVKIWKVFRYTNIKSYVRFFPSRESALAYVAHLDSKGWHNSGVKYAGCFDRDNWLLQGEDDHLMLFGYVPFLDECMFNAMGVR